MKSQLFNFERNREPLSTSNLPAGLLKSFYFGGRSNSVLGPLKLIPKNFGVVRDLGLVDTGFNQSATAGWSAMEKPLFLMVLNQPQFVTPIGP